MSQVNFNFQSTFQWAVFVVLIVTYSFLGCYFPKPGSHPARSPLRTEHSEKETNPSPKGSGKKTVPSKIPYGSLVFESSDKLGINPFVLAALIIPESSGRADVESPSGAIGLTQLLLPTARQHQPHVTEEELKDPRINLRIAAKHIAWLTRLVEQHFPNVGLEQKIKLIAAAWNVGWSTVYKARGIPNNDSVRHFCEKVWHYYQLYRFGKIDCHASR